MKKGFVFNEFLSERNRNTPKVSDLSKKGSEGNCFAEPRQSILDMDWERRQWFCVVVKTDIHVVRKLAFKVGQFGHQCNFDITDTQHCNIEQLSWAHGTFDKAKDLKKPWDRYLTWSMKAQRCDLRTALVDLLNELKRVLDKGGGLCMYDIEFEAGVVMETLRALQLPDNYLSRWHDAATMGKALLNTDLLQWAFNYPSSIELIELQKFCEHTLGKTVSSSEPGLQCWMLFRKMYFKVNEHTTNAKKLSRNTDIDVAKLVSNSNVSQGPLPQNMINVGQSSKHGLKVVSPQVPKNLVCDKTPERRRGFSLKHCSVPPQPKKMKVDMTKIRVGSIETLPAPEVVRKKFASTHSHLISIDVETHSLIHGNIDFHDGDFGFQRKVHPSNFGVLRAVQIAWAIGDISSSEPDIKSRYVKPIGFSIENEATAIHKISHKHAMIHGLPLASVLREMFADIKDACQKGGRICAHQLEFDAGVLAAEMGALGFDDMRVEWSSMVKNGICTMDPDIAKWVRAQIGWNDVAKFVPLKLTDAMTELLPEYAHLVKCHHDAANDCYMHWLLARDLRARALA